MASSERQRVSGIMTIVSMPPRTAQAASRLIVPISPILPNNTGNRKALIEAAIRPPTTETLCATERMRVGVNSTPRMAAPLTMLGKVMNITVFVKHFDGPHAFA